MKRLHYVFLFLLVFLVSGCSHVVSKNLRKQVDPALTFQQVFQNPDGYKEKIVIWGGDVIQITNQKDGTTLIEVLERPLSRRGGPKDTLPSGGRFLVLVEEYLDPYLFRRGRRVTVAGEIQGHKIRPLGEMDYRYPLLLSKQIYFWEDYYYSYPPYYNYPYYYYGPWWGYPYGWGPPYGWRYYYPY